MNDVLSYLSNVNNCWLKKKKKKIYVYIEQKWKSKIELNFSQWIYLFIPFFFFCNKTKRENDIWTNELAEYYLTLLKENNNKKKKKNTDPQFFQRYFSLLSNDISNLIKCSLSNNIFKSNYFF